MSNNPLRLCLAVFSVAALGVLGCKGDDDASSAATSVPSAVATVAATNTPEAVATAAPTPEATVVVVDPCTLRDSLEGQPLAQGEAFGLDTQIRWQLCLGGAAAGSSEKYLYKTSDGGANWTLLAMTTLGNPPPEPGVGELPNGNAAEALFFIDEQTGWLGLSSPGENLFRSGDGGVTWTFVDVLEPGVPVLNIDFTDADNGTLTTPDGDWTTSDGGATWVEAP
jgi:hypothetical protein